MSELAYRIYSLIDIGFLANHSINFFQVDTNSLEIQEVSLN